MADKGDGNRGGVEAALADFMELLGKAILSGIAASVVLALITLGLATTASAQATPDDAKTGTLNFRCDTEPWSVAPTPSPRGEHTGVGALWARARIASQVPQTDTESTLQILLGLLALAAAGMVALVGRCIPAGGAAHPEGTR